LDTSFSYDRFQRQLILKNFGKDAQQKLWQAKVLVVGAGGLGCPALQYLSAIGIGNIGIVDHDRVSLSNLHRQILFSSNDLGKLKTEVVKEKLFAQNDQINFSLFTFQLDQTNAISILSNFDVVIDCSDNFKVRYIMNDACLLLNKPLIFGAVYQYEGQVGVFNYQAPFTNYRDLFPSSPSSTDTPNCEEAGVFNITTGIIGLWQAAEAIKIITGIGEVLSNKLLTYNALNSSIYAIEILKNKNSCLNIPATENELLSFDYDQFCGLPSSHKDSVSPEEFDSLIESNNVQIIDIRNEHELPKVEELNAFQIPLSSLKNNIELLEKEKQIVLFCHSGIRTQTALELLQDEFHMSNVSHLEGGIVKWLDYKSKKKTWKKK
jgi:molybdopterin/thiamine biosynthesis adenylyltransferase/rhodanese-related sulfurtransferase